VQTAIPSLTQSARGDGAVAIITTAKNMRTILPLRVIVRPLSEKSIARKYSRSDGITCDAASEEINAIRRAGTTGGGRRIAPFDIAG
jgi:hypothetical protein